METSVQTFVNGSFLVQKDTLSVSHARKFLAQCFALSRDPMLDKKKLCPEKKLWTKKTLSFIQQP
jgi:hypothetical protein